MRAIIILLCVAIGLVILQQPPQPETTAQAQEQVAAQPIVDNRLDDVLELLRAHSTELKAIEECQQQDQQATQTRLVALEALESCDCDCDCDAELAVIKERLAKLEAKPAAVKQPARTPVRTAVGVVGAVAAAPLKAARSNWTYPGRIDNHLSSSEHAGELAARGINISGMSQAQMEAIHSSLHESRSTVTSRSFPQPVRQQAYSNCPGGVCPAGPSVQRSSGGWYLGKAFGR